MSETIMSRRRKQRTTLAMAAMLLLSAPIALPTNDMRPLTVMILSQMCAMQDPEYRDNAFGRRLASRPGFEGWEEVDRRPLPQCLRERQWVPKSLCASVTTLEAGDPRKFEAWWQENVDTLRTLEPVFDFYGQVLEEKTSASPCPDIALQAKSPPRPPGITIERVELVWAGEYEGAASPVPRVELVKSTDRIAAAVGVHFGIYFNIVSSPAEGILTVLSRTTVPDPGLPGVSVPGQQRVITDRSQCILGRPDGRNQRDLLIQLSRELPDKLAVAQALGRSDCPRQRSAPPRCTGQGALKFFQRLVRALQIQQQFTELLARRDDWAGRYREFFDCVFLISCVTQDL